MDQQSLLAALNLSTFTVLDFETTGLNPTNDRIIELAAIRFVSGEPVDRFVTLINPDGPIDPLITDITGITDEMVAQAPHEKEIVDRLLQFLGEAPLVAHNIPFDFAFLQALCQRYGKEIPAWDLYDTLQLSRTYLFFQPVHNLGMTSEYFDFSSHGSHRAETDTENCGRIFLALVREAASYPLEITSKILELIRPFDVPNKQLFVHLANLLMKQGDLKRGLLPSTINKGLLPNVFSSEGSGSLVNITAEEVFETNGFLNKELEAFEERGAQVEYCHFVEKVLNTEGARGVVEAGTGLGKSFAYLFASLKHAFQQEDEGPVIVSCCTKHLQDQLFYRDLPVLVKALDIPLQAVLLKGRNNYLCKTRLEWLIRDARNLLKPHEVESLLPILIWLQWTQTGDLSECPGFWNSRPVRVASLIQCEPGFCTTTLCGRNQGCFFGPLRKTIYQADLLVINHALLLSETHTDGLLPPHNVVVIDEAHNLIDVAYQRFTLRLDIYQFMTVLERINPASSHSLRWKQILKPLEKLNPDLENLRESLQKRIQQTLTSAQTFYQELGEQVKGKFNPQALYSQKVIIENLVAEYAVVHGELSTLENALLSLAGAIEQFLGKLLKIDPDKEDFPELHQLFEQGLEAVKALSLTLTLLTREQDQGWVYWQEGSFQYPAPGRERFDLVLNGAPIDVAQELSTQMFSQDKQFILTSATLRVGSSFDYFLNRTGLTRVEGKTVETAFFPSPFHYEDQVTYYQYAGTSQNDPHFIADLIYHCHTQTNKRILALFTARNTLQKVYHALRAKPGGRDLPLFAQLYGTSRYALLKGLRRVENGILLGTNAFWEGIDLPGEFLEILIITKLPFDVPSEPIVKAYGQMLNEEGRNAFLEYAVPECIIRFRQGFGRLIRTIYDEGCFIVLDGRIVSKQYGRHFVEAIPTRMHLFEHPTELTC